MNSSLEINNNIKDNKSVIKKEDEEINFNEIISNNIEASNNIFKTEKNYNTENNINNNKIDVNSNNNEMIDNIRDMLIMSKQINNNISKIKHENVRYNIMENRTNQKNHILLKYEDYKAKLKKFNMNNSLKNKKKNKKLNFYRTSNTTTVKPCLYLLILNPSSKRCLCLVLGNKKSFTVIEQQQIN